MTRYARRVVDEVVTDLVSRGGPLARHRHGQAALAHCFAAQRRQNMLGTDSAIAAILISILPVIFVYLWPG